LARGRLLVMSLDFTAIDFETANGSPASPCAVGLVRIRDSKIVDSFELLFQPPEPHNWFSAANIRVHGITPQMIDSASTFSEALDRMLGFIESDLLVAHNASFDMGVLAASANATSKELPEIFYGCSLKIARKTYNLDSYRLNAVAYAVGHEEFEHHNALADSEACARIVIHAANRHGVQDLPALLKATKVALGKL
jgi:DNA polymerase III subunit epsilon